jgi:flagellar biosynthetic protein FlhB
LHYGNDLFQVFRVVTVQTVWVLIPFFLTVLGCSVAFTLAQGGLVLKPMEWEFRRINPLNGLKNIYSLTGLTEALKNLLKFVLGALLIYHFLRRSLAVFPYLVSLETADMAREAGRLMLRAFFYGFLFYLVLAVFDYFLQRRNFERSLRMSKQEIRDETKEIEGHPLIKSRIRSLQREMARRRMMEEVPKATVVITNPQHLAVALRYQEKELPAPKVVAKGAGEVAQRIKEIARRHGVPIVEDKPLARALFALDLGAFIPPELYKAVAKIIAHLYRMKGRTTS